MITGPDNLFAFPELDALLREELAQFPVHAARLPAGRALIVQPCAANRELAFDTRQLAAARMHVERKALRGDVICEPDALPWEDEAFQLVVSQHAGDVLPAGAHLIDELARVLAPGGTLLWFGLNPWSPWLAWIHWQARRGIPLPHAGHAEAARKRMQACHLAAQTPDYFGTCWPQGSGAARIAQRSRLLAPLRNAYLITASKRRAVLTPLRPRTLRERVPLGAQLASPSRRASA